MRRTLFVAFALTLVAGCAKQKDVTVNVTAPNNGIAAIAGHVYSSYYDPIAGATVTASPGLPAVVTDSSGIAIWQNVPAPAIYTFEVSKPGYVPAKATFGVSAGEAYQFGLWMQRTDTLRVLRSATVSDYTADLAVVDSTAFLACASGLDVRDLRVARFGARLGHVDIPMYPYRHKLAVAGLYAYVATGYSTLAVVDIATPTAPVLVRSITLPDAAHDVAVDGTLLVIADNDSVLFMSIADPAQPARIGAVKVMLDGINQGCYGVALDPTRHVAVVCSFNNGIELVRYDDPHAPVYANQISGGLNPYDADVDPARGIAAIAGDGGVTLLDYTDTTNPSVLASFAPPGNGGYDALLVGERVLFATSFNGLELMDFSQLSAPKLTSRLYGGAVGAPMGLERAGAGAYVAGNTRLSLVEIPPLAPAVARFRITHHPIAQAGPRASLAR